MIINPKLLKIIVSILFIALFITIYLFWDDIFFGKIDNNAVEKINITINGLFAQSINENINAVIEDKNSIISIINLEDLIRKKDGTNRLLKRAPWKINIEYTLSDGRVISRYYKGQKNFEELRTKLSEIPEIKKEVK